MENYNPHPQGYRPEWYTPAHIVEFATYVLGGRIELDAASCAEANETVQATRYFSVDDDGLGQSWAVGTGNGVWCNPPYGRGNTVYRWWKKMKTEFDAGHFDMGLFLANSKTETRWFQEALEICPVLLFRARLRFRRPANEPVGEGHFGSALVLLSRPIDGSYRPYRGFSDLPYNSIEAGGGDDAALARFMVEGRKLGQVVISL